MNHNYLEILQHFPCSRSCLSMPREETRDGVLLKFCQFQDNFYRHQAQLPGSSTSAILAVDRQDGRSLDRAIEELLAGNLEMGEKLSRRILRKLGLNKQSERVVHCIVPTTMTRGLNAGWISWISTVHEVRIHRRRDQDRHGMKLERFKIRTLSVLVEGDVKESQKAQ